MQCHSVHSSGITTQQSPWASFNPTTATEPVSDLKAGSPKPIWKYYLKIILEYDLWDNVKNARKSSERCTSKSVVTVETVETGDTTVETVEKILGMKKIAILIIKNSNFKVLQKGVESTAI